MCFFFFKQKTAYEMRISDWSSDVCSSDLEVETTLMARPMVARKLGYTISLESAAEQGIREGSLAVRPIEALRLERIVARSAEHAPPPAAPAVTQRPSTTLKERFPPPSSEMRPSAHGGPRPPPHPPPPTPQPNTGTTT